MQQDLVHAIRSNPKYHELVSKRSKFAWTLAAAMLVIYYGVIPVSYTHLDVYKRQIFLS